MNKPLPHYLLLLVFLLISNVLFAQNYPVTCTPIVRPSYSLKWSEISTSSEMFKVHLLLKDLTKPSVDVYLKIRLSGVGVDIRTVDGFIPNQTIHLNPGSAMLLSSADLAEYFNISNLVVDGIDISALYAGGRLPEGLYTWTVEAYEIDRNRQVSNTGMALMNVFKNYPPIINIPQEGAILPVTSPQNILFSWTSRSTASLNAAQGKTYKLRIYPLNAGEDPNMVANSGIQPIEITTTTPYFNYGAANIALEKGKRYAVQVQEEDVNGLDDYENEGKSQVVSFSFGKPCVAPEGLIINPIGKGRVELSPLTPDRGTFDSDYQLTAWYKEENATIWNSLLMNNGKAIISNLKDKTAYEFKVSSNCGGNTNAFGALDNSNPVLDGLTSDPIEFTIDDSTFDEKIEELDPSIFDPFSIKVELLSDGTSVKPQSVADIFEKIIKPKCANDASVYETCSLTHPAPPPPKGENLTTLAVGDVLGIYDYAVLVTEVGGGNTLSGKGLVKLPFLENSYMAVEFSGIKVKKGEEGTKGGCVSEVPNSPLGQSDGSAGSGYFRTRPISQVALQNEQVRTISDIIKLTDPTVFHGDLEVAIQKYQEKGSEIATKGTATLQEKQNLLTYTKGVEVAVNTWKDKFSEVFGSGETDPKIAEILGDMATILTQLNADKQTIEVGTNYPTIPDLKVKMDAIIEKIMALQEAKTPKLPKIQNVLATNIGYDNATLTWQGDSRFTKYVISYKTADGGELIEIVNLNRLSIKNLQENSWYGFKIEGYVDNNLVDSYINGLFTTLIHKLLPPNNLVSTKLSGKSTKLSWDKDPKHKSYQLTYKSRDGELHTLYPTTNTIIIDNLDPTETYPYEVIALSDNLRSDAANSDFTTGLACDVTINVSSSIISVGENTTLNASCNGLINWYNGGQDIGIIQSGGSITWQDGEIGIITSDKKTLTVTPAQNTTYMAVCEVSDGIETKSCTSSTSITVQPAICKNFVINTSTTSIEEGYPVTLTANGCTGNFSWNNGLGIENPIAIRIIEKSTFIATCTSNEGVCVASTIINVKKEVNCGCGDIYLKNITKYSCGFLSLGNCESYLFAIDCQQNKNPAMKWSYIGDADKYPSSQGNLYRIDNIDGAVTVLANFSDGTNTCQKSTIVTSKKSGCDFSIKQKLEADGSVTLTQVGCNAGNTVKWDDGSGGIKGILTQQPSISVPPINKNYTAICEKNACVAKTYVENPVQFGLLVTSNDLLGKSKSHDEKILNIGETEYPVKMEALYCSGSVTWTSSPSTELNIQGNNIAITAPPTQTTTYTATCVSENNIILQQSVTLNVSSKNCFAIEAPAVIEMGEEATLTVTENSGCIGDVTWFEGTEQIDEAFEIDVTPLQTTTYTAKCNNPQCTESVTIKVKPCSLVITTSAPNGTTSIKMGETITLSTDGCSAGTINWKGGDADGEEGSEITVRPFEKTTYTATCDIVEGCSKGITIDVIVDLPPKIPCEDFKLLADKTEGNIGDKITLTANGCTGGTITWPSNSTTIAINIAKITITTCGENIYSATCQKSGQTGTAQVKVNGKLNFTVEPATASIAVNSVKNVTLTASGCEGGTIYWTTGEATSIITVTQVGSYSATCTLATCPTSTKSSIISSSCPDLKILASKNTIETTSEITLTVNGCTGGTITWNDGLISTNIVRNISVTPPQSFTATCSLCTINNKASTTITKLVIPNQTACDEAGFTTTASRNVFYEGEDAISLGISGAYNCPNPITWNTPNKSNIVIPTNNTSYYAICNYNGSTCKSKSVTIDFRGCDSFQGTPVQSYSATTVVKYSGCYGVVSWNGAKQTGNNNGSPYQFEISTPKAATNGTISCDKPLCNKQIIIPAKKECPTLTWGENPTCFQERGWDGRLYTSDQHTFTLDYNACPYYAITLANEYGELANERTAKTLRIVRSATAPRKLILRCFSDATHSTQVCQTETPYLPPSPLGINSCPIVTTASTDTNSEPNSRATIDGNSSFCDTPIPMSTAATGYLAKLCEEIGNMKDENGNSFLKNADGTMSEANAQQMINLVEQALKNSDNSDLSNFTRLLDQTAILEALQAGNCAGFGAEMAKGYSNTITAGGYNSNILNTFEATQRTALMALYQLPDAIRAILARIRQGNIEKKESISISDIIHNYQSAFGVGKIKNGVIDYHQPLVLSDGKTIISEIQLIFSDNILKTNTFPLPAAIDISLKDRHEKDTSLSYGYESKTSTNWIIITDNKTDEFEALKQYLSPPSYTATFQITGEQLREIFCVDSKGKSIPLEKCKTPSLERCNDIKNVINKYSDKFEINTPLRMAHFLGQIGVETGRLKYTKEIPCYKEKAIRSNFGLAKYCDLYVGFDCVDLAACATSTEMVKCSQGVPTTNENIKQKYICSAELFDYVYSCSARLKGGKYDLGNGSPKSKDGSTFLGRGFIQLTGKFNYQQLSNEWNNDSTNTKNKKYFHKQLSEGGNIDELEMDLDVAMKASMYYWQMKRVNPLADSDDIGEVTRKVKGSKDEGEVRARGKIKDKALTIFKQ